MHILFLPFPIRDVFLSISLCLCPFLSPSSLIFPFLIVLPEMRFRYKERTKVNKILGEAGQANLMSMILLLYWTFNQLDSISCNILWEKLIH